MIFNLLHHNGMRCGKSHPIIELYRTLRYNYS